MGKSRKTNPAKQSVTMADVKRAKAQAMHEAMIAAWSIMFTVLRDKEGYDLEGLRRVWAEVDDLSDSIAKGYCTVPDLKHILKQEIGANIT